MIQTYAGTVKEMRKIKLVAVFKMSSLEDLIP